MASTYYQDEEHASAAYMLRHTGNWRAQYWHAPFLNRFTKRKGMLLDVGCGEGSFLLCARRLGFDVHGVDFDSKSAKAARNRLGSRNIHNMPLDEFIRYAQKEGLSFDVVTFFEVLEHQADPCKFLANIKDILRPGGWIAGSTPNRERFLAESERRAGDIDFPPHHFFWFSRDSLVHLLSRSGFTPDVSMMPGTIDRAADLLQVILAGPFLRNARSSVFAYLAKKGGSKGNSFEIKRNLAKAYILLKKMSLFPFYPLAIFLMKTLPGKEPNLYFEARRVD